MYGFTKNPLQLFFMQNFAPHNQHFRRYLYAVVRSAVESNADELAVTAGCVPERWVVL